MLLYLNLYNVCTINKINFYQELKELLERIAPMRGWTCEYHTQDLSTFYTDILDQDHLKTEPRHG